MGRSRWNFGSFHLWGDVPALMPTTRAIKNQGGSWFNVAHNTTSGHGQNPDGRKFHASGRAWFDLGPAAHGSGSVKRKAASAMMAKIPLALARHIAAVYRPQAEAA